MEEESSAQYRSYRPVLADSFQKQLGEENDYENNNAAGERDEADEENEFD